MVTVLVINKMSVTFMSCNAAKAFFGDQFDELRYTMDFGLFIFIFNFYMVPT